MRRSILSIVLPICTPFILVACEDPKVALRDQTELKIRQAGEALAVAAHRASLDRVAAAESLRSASAGLAGLNGATATQGQVAASLMTTASTQAGSLEIGRADQLESANRTSRMLASGLLNALDGLEAFVASESDSGLSEESEQLSPTLSEATAAQSEQTTQLESLSDEVATLRTANEQALGEAQNLAAEAEEIRQRGLKAARGEITRIAEEAGQKRDEARAKRTFASQAEVSAAHLASRQRIQANAADDANNRVKVIQGVRAALDQFSNTANANATQAREIGEALRASILTLTTSANPGESAELTGCYERAFADFDSASSSAGRSGSGGGARFEIAAVRARALLLRGEGEFQQAVLLHSIATSPSFAPSQREFSTQAKDLLAKAQASTQEALDTYSTLAESLANGSGDNASKQALAASIDRALKSIHLPSFDGPATSAAAGSTATPQADPVDESAAAPAEVAAQQAGAGDGPPFGSVEDLAAFLGDSRRDPEMTLGLDALLIATTPEGDSLAATAFGAEKALAGLRVAMKEKFGSADLGPLSAMTSQGVTATVEDPTDSTATISLGGPQGSLSFNAVSTDSGWKLDLDATAAQMTEGMRAQIQMAGTMMKGLTGTITAITAQVQGGELTSGPAVQMALMTAVQSMMSGGAVDPSK